MLFFKRQLPIMIAFTAGLLLWVQFYVPSAMSQRMLEKFTGSWAIILAGCALILGLLSAFQHHWSKVHHRKLGFAYSLVILFCFGFVVLAGCLSSAPLLNGSFSWQYFAAAGLVLLGILLTWRYAVLRLRGGDGGTYGAGLSALMVSSIGLTGLVFIVPLQQIAFTGNTIMEGSFFDWIFQNMFVPLDATMFSLLAFYIASAAFRAFRARSFEATALLIAGCIVMIGRVPLGEMIGGEIFGYRIDFSVVASWILNNPNAAAQRGILLGVLLSMVAISLRIMFGIERTYMGGGD